MNGKIKNSFALKFLTFKNYVHNFEFSNTLLSEIYFIHYFFRFVSSFTDFQLRHSNVNRTLLTME